MKIIIFSTGIAGRAIYRKLKDSHTIINFIENNKNLENTYYDKVKIISVENIVNKEFDKIAIGGIWIDSMKEQLLKLNISEDKILIIEDNLFNFSMNARVEETDVLIKEFAQLMYKNDISYCIEGSSLLCLLRNQNLSDVPDVDVLIKSQDDLEKIWLIINDNELFIKNQLTKVIYNEDKILTKKGTINKIIIKSKSNPAITEPTVIDLKLVIDTGKYYIMDYVSEYSLFFNKKFIDGKNYFKYKDMNLLIPYKEKEYVKLLYGETWMIPAKKWSYKDYGNLIENDKLLKFIEESKK